MILRQTVVCSRRLLMQVRCYSRLFLFQQRQHVPGLKLQTCNFHNSQHLPSSQHQMSHQKVATPARQLLDEAISDATATSSEARAQALMDFYLRLAPAEKLAVLRVLAVEYQANGVAVVHGAQQLLALAEEVKDSIADEASKSKLLRAEDRLRAALAPRYQRVFSSVGRAVGGVKFLVDMRADLLDFLTLGSVEKDLVHLKSLSLALKDILTLWFGIGFLQLVRVTWQSPCDLLEKVSAYEAVHPVEDWQGLKQRVGPYRRCYAFVHGSMPREPIVVLHTALTSEISSDIQPILQASLSPEAHAAEDPAMISTAVFYSITSTQKGLQGIELGNYLIKKVVREIQAELPHVTQFSSLSPIPGFRDWLLSEINLTLHMPGKQPELRAAHALLKPDELSRLGMVLAVQSVAEHERATATLEALKKTLTGDSWPRQNQLLTELLRAPLLRLCARYLYLEKKRGIAINAVANFHLRNGATMWRLNWLADTSPRGLRSSCGIMVNYRYFLQKTDTNSRQYVDHQVIDASDEVVALTVESKL